ncbi:hypothetical protein ACLI4U_11200 [Natrialbaceae archaeon A-CW2]
MDRHVEAFVRGDSPTECTPGFLQSRLELMKETGCNLLVTGSVVPEVTFHATRNLFGADQAKTPRQRLLACTDLEPPANHYLLTGYEQPPERVTTSGIERGVTTVDSPIDHTLTSQSSWLRSYQRNLCESIADIDASVDGLEPSQFRLAFLTLRPILENDCSYEAGQFLRVVTDVVEGVSGMAHYHLPVANESPLVEECIDHFDVQIQLRNPDGGSAETRWRFPDADTITPWHKL